MIRHKSWKMGRPWQTGRILLLIILLAGPSIASAAGPIDPQNPPQGSRPTGEISDQELDRLLSIAEAKMEIVKLDIRQGQFERVLPEMKSIYELNLPSRYEENVAQAAAVTAQLLAEQKQWDLAHKVLDEAFLRMKINANKSKVLIFKAFIFKSEGKLAKARETYEQALAIEKL